MTMSSLGSSIGVRRAEAGLTQVQLASRAGVSRATIAALETGRVGELGFTKLTRILTVLGLELTLQRATAGRPTLDDLMAEEDASQ